MANREIAHYEQFLLLPQCFSKVACCRDVKKRLYEGKGKSARKNLGIFFGRIRELHENEYLLNIIENTVAKRTQCCYMKSEFIELIVRTDIYSSLCVVVLSV